MDVGKDGSPLKFLQTPEPHPRRAHAPDVVGTWSLRNREQLRKRKAEAQEKQTSQWNFGEQKKRKCQRTGRGNPRGPKRQGGTAARAQPQSPPQSPTEKQRMQKALDPAEEETRHPVNPVTEALPLVACPPKAGLAEHCSEAHQQSIQCQDLAPQNHSQAHRHRAKPEDLSPNTCSERAVLQYSSAMCPDTDEPEALSPEMCQETAVLAQNPSSKAPQDMAGPEALSPKMCQETAVLAQNHSSKAPQDMAGPEALSPKMCQETAVPQNLSSKAPQDTAGPEALSSKMCQIPAVLREHTSKMCQDVARPEVVSPKTRQEMAVVPWITLGGAAGPERCSPEALLQSGVPEGCPLDTCPTSVTPEKTSQADQAMAVTEGCFSETRECPVSEDISSKIHQEAVEPEFIFHETYKPTEPTVSSHQTSQDSPGPEDHSPETCQPMSGLEYYSPETCHEMPGPEDLSLKTCENRDGPKDRLPEHTQEAELEEKAKGSQDPATPSRPQGPQEICREDDTYSYVLI
ncbi:hemogen isoform X2 [Peromyscus leucopus]|uniref:hemogen isoform X2 n=1 Tax=Peromyscus leucopus TaxID=10041 RepID=UPI001884E37D|nr:hemogen isoform X2 [Peromyscus leucopus]